MRHELPFKFLISFGYLFIFLLWPLLVLEWQPVLGKIKGLVLILVLVVQLLILGVTQVPKCAPHLILGPLNVLQ